jgi:hypothetical protein
MATANGSFTVTVLGFTYRDWFVAGVPQDNMNDVLFNLQREQCLRGVAGRDEPSTSTPTRCSPIRAASPVKPRL